jgi:hypothetical protein
MPSLAATATPDAGPLAAFFGLLIIGSAVLTLGYLFGCWLWPFAACRRCHGSGKRRSPFGRSFALCRRCDGDGRRLRIGRRVINSLRDLHDNANR